jgi:hypothetical protein
VAEGAGKFLNVHVVGSGHHSKEILIPGLHNDGLGDFSTRDVHDGRSALSGVGRRVSDRQIGDMALFQVIFDASGDWHGLTPFFG